MIKVRGDDSNLSRTELIRAHVFVRQSIPLRNLLRTNETFSEYLTNSLSVPSTTATSLMRVKVRLGQLPALSSEGDLRSVLCSDESVNRILEFNSSNQKADFQNITCSLTANQLLQARQVFMQNVDNMKLLNALPIALGLNRLETGVLMAKTGVHITPLMTVISNFGSSALLSAVGTLDFRSDPFGSLSELMCGTDSNTTSKTTSRDVLRTVSTESDQQNTRAATADDTNTTSTNTSEYCKNLTDTMESSSSLRLLWKTVRPFLQGKILYTPDTNVTRSIVTET
ncbi:phospholipid-transporting ATPase ABCA1-like [Pimephales promelas]|uniref:phospholipid-transporting ATPase ABCA1-like n=1 Tax=Pimephales promelas TaxID=90988 RepID=UPI001955E0B8|nr:phospholipid-transporting ATPase ABCA1-like [Pimephales promelas]